MKKLIITSFVLLFTLSSNAQWWGKGERVKGNGNVEKETRKTSDYHGVNLGGSFDIILVKGKEGNLTLEGESNLLPYIITEVKNGKLSVKVKKGYNIKTTRKLTVTVPIKDIDKIALGGSGNIIGKTVIDATELSLSIGGSGNIEVKVEADKINSSLAGSGDIIVSGNTSSLKCSVAGSGSIKAYDLQTTSLRASIAGSGNISASVKSEINASIAGSGKIYYKGNPPKVKTRAIGSGKVVKKG